MLSSCYVNTIGVRHVRPSSLAADPVSMWRHRERVTDQEQPIDVAHALTKPEGSDLRILRLLDEAGSGHSLSHACCETNALAVMVIGSGAGTFCEFDLSLERLEALGMIRLDEEGVVSLSEQGRDWFHSLGCLVKQGHTSSVSVLTAA
jgi:hypothetical protein